MKNEIEQTVERIGQLPDDSRVMINPTGGGEAVVTPLIGRNLRELGSAYTQLKADLATAKQGLERYGDASNWHNEEFTSNSVPFTAKCFLGASRDGNGYDLAQQTLAAIGKE